MLAVQYICIFFKAWIRKLKLEMVNIILIFNTLTIDFKSNLHLYRTI